MIDAAISTECDTFYGAFFGKQTRFAVLDIDIESKYHAAAELDKLTTALDSVGLAIRLGDSEAVTRCKVFDVPLSVKGCLFSAFSIA